MRKWSNVTFILVNTPLSGTFGDGPCKGKQKEGLGTISVFVESLLPPIKITLKTSVMSRYHNKLHETLTGHAHALITSTQSHRRTYPGYIGLKRKNLVGVQFGLLN